MDENENDGCYGVVLTITMFGMFMAGLLIAVTILQLTGTR